MPLPALAEKIKPALKIVKMAKPFAFCRMLRGITPSRPLLPLSTNDLTVGLYLKGGVLKKLRSLTYVGGLDALFVKRLGQWSIELHV
jgi:hypothetical protein